MDHMIVIARLVVQLDGQLPVVSRCFRPSTWTCSSRLLTSRAGPGVRTC